MNFWEIVRTVFAFAGIAAILFGSFELKKYLKVRFL